MLLSHSSRAELATVIKSALQLHQSGKLQEAEELYRGVIARHPADFDALHLLGMIYQQRGDYVSAASYIAKALRINGKNPVAFNNYGAALRALGRPAEAEQAYRKALKLNPDYIEAYYNLGNALTELKRLKEAEKAYLKALDLQPDYAEAYSNLASLLIEQRRPEEAEKACSQALMFKPQSAKAYYNLGNALHDQHRLEEAETAYFRALEIQPGYADAELALGLLKLLQGEYDLGLRLFEKRFHTGTASARAEIRAIMDSLQHHGYSSWDGSALDGKTLLVIAEQGFGDCLMMMRYLSSLKRRNLKKLIVYCYSPLKRLFQVHPDVDETTLISEPIPFGSFDIYCPMMSLPYLFHTRLDSIPNEVPYVVIPDENREMWSSRLPRDPSVLRVGLAWAGGKMTSTDQLRSIPLKQFLPLFGINDVQLFSLQKGDEARQSRKLGVPLLDYMDECGDFLDSAALIDQLDLVISVDTSVAHLAGALGKPVWMLNRFESEWRWMLHRENSPWYPSMRIFSQDVRGEWCGVIERTVMELANMRPAQTT